MARWRAGLDKGLDIANRHQTKIRFLLAGAFNTVIGLSVYPALFFLAAPLKLHYLVILTISQIVCITFAFLTNKFLVFRTSGNYLRESGKFLMFHLSYFLVNLAALPALVELAGMTPVWGQTLFAVLIIVTSYFWHSRITFSSSKATR
ncbi:GtrA family protein [Polaromonas sp. YR568]|uniref:GtrA family protein n=1 Tax=Polaromonas sp. YR568 TaxID=1855301 RepID=UPI003137AA5F